MDDEDEKVERLVFPDGAAPAPCEIWGPEPTLERIKGLRADPTDEEQQFIDELDSVLL